MLSTVRAFIRRHDLIRADTRVVAAVSGGSDSMALLHLLHAHAARGEMRLVGVAHFNHGLRPTAGDDESFVAKAASALGLPFVVDHEDVRARARSEHRSLEDAGRTARHAFFERARQQLDADVVALGHTRDDQAETFLLRLVRGAGPRGLSGMHPRHGSIVRPLLDCRRQELVDWLGDRPYVHDESNDDVGIPRNRVRRELIPLLAARFNPAIVDVLAREADVLQDVWSWMEEAEGPFLVAPGRLDCEALARVPVALRRLVVWRAMLRASGGRDISADHVADVLRLAEAGGAESASLDLPGHRVQRIGAQIVLTSKDAGRDNSSGASDAAPANLFEIPLSIPGEVVVPLARCRVSADQTARVADLGRADTGNGAVAVVRRDSVHGSLVVRNRRPGDRFRPVGLGGSKKLQDLFVDRKLPREERDLVPIVVDETDQIVWVAGYGIDESFRVMDPSEAVLVLRLTRA
ncbi:MAG TPA: tRNA lysidine(34) synthetase TilS [Vicinamibacterales bacterium]